MKKNCSLFFLLCLLFWSTNAFANFPIAGQLGVRTSRYNSQSFKRTFNQPLQAGKTTAGSYQVSYRRSSIVTPASISTADFASHLNVGNQRSFQYAEVSGGTISMDIGGIDVEGVSPQIWNLPDLSTYNAATRTLNHIPVAEAIGASDFPETTHALKWADSNQYEFYQLSDVDLFFLGYIEDATATKPQTFDYYSTLSPVPLDLGDGFTGIITFIYEGESEPDSIEYHQFYDVVGYGTLNTANRGSDDALKLIFTEQEFVYKNGAVVEQSEYSEIVWYSKKGLYVRAGINDPWNSEGVVDLQYVEYQYLTTEVPVAPSVLTATVQSAGTVNLQWVDNSVNETGFQVQRSLSSAVDNTGAFTTVDATFSLGANATQFTDSGLPAGQTYYYQIRAMKN